ncbi:hypothetical protein C0J52_09093 [Blattella germanica]|nr:hypothetical protein C0J52_09093 [Blattella germanica]
MRWCLVSCCQDERHCCECLFELFKCWRSIHTRSASSSYFQSNPEHLLHMKMDTSSSGDEVIVVDNLGRVPPTESSSSFSGGIGGNDGSSESDDCIIIDDAVREEEEEAQQNEFKPARITCRQTVSAHSSPPRFTESGYPALRRSSRHHQKLNFSKEDFYHETRFKSTPSMNTRSVTRRLGLEGCVLDPPTPEDELEMRDWPSEGMHERPVWPDSRYDIPCPPPQPASELEVAVHHSLHAVLAFAAQLGKTVADVSMALLSDEPEFPAHGIFAEDEKEDSTHKLMDLLLYTGLLYCAVCSVPQHSLADYINSLSIDSALEWFTEMNATK